MSDLSRRALFVAAAGAAIAPMLPEIAPAVASVPSNEFIAYFPNRIWVSHGQRFVTWSDAGGWESWDAV